MNEETARRLAEAAEAVLDAADAVAEAHAAMSDARFLSDQERDRANALKHAISRIDQAAVRVEGSLRKAAVAALLAERDQVFPRYTDAVERARRSRHEARTAADIALGNDVRADLETALAHLDDAQTAAASLTFGD